MRRSAACVAGAVLAFAAFAAIAGARPAITGFQVSSDPVRLIDVSASSLTTVGVDGVNLTGPGTLSAPDAGALRQLARAHRDGLRAELLIGNWSDAVGDFYEPLAWQTLGDPAAIAQVAGSLADLVRGQGWDGVSVDLESLAPRDRPGLTAFVQALRAALGAGASVSVCVTNYTSATDFADNGYALSELGRSASRVILMGYDEHGPWENMPGPVGSLGWQRAGLRVLLRSVPAAEIDLGVAGYGYGWRPREKVQLSDAAARALVRRDHARARFAAQAGEWTAKLSDGSVLWWSDARSFALRVRLARRLHLHGLAVWSLGQSDPISAP